MRALAALLVGGWAWGWVHPPPMQGAPLLIGGWAWAAPLRGAAV